MKKLGVSLVAVLVGLPMMAHATISDISGAGAVTSNTNVATTSYVKGAYNAMANAVNTAIGQANTDIAAKQAQLTAGGNNISATVKTTVGEATGEGAATDGSLVTEKAVRDAIDTAKSATTYTQGSGITISNNEISASGITTSNIAANAGIVKTQLDSGVQTSLGLADTALQVSNLDNVTIEKDTTNGVQVKAGSIGTTQLASGVVTSLGKADTALQANSALDGANLDAGSVAKTALASGVQTSLGLADSAVQSVTTGDAESGNGTIKVDGTAVSVYGLGSAAFVNTNAIAGTSGTFNDTTAQLGTNSIQGAIEAVAASAATANGTKGFNVYGNWATPDTATGHVNVAAESDLQANPQP